MPCADDRCNQCQTLDSTEIANSTLLQCDQCFTYVNDFTPAKKIAFTCGLCDSINVDNCLACDEGSQDKCMFCDHNYYLDKVENLCLACNDTYTLD